MDSRCATAQPHMNRAANASPTDRVPAAPQSRPPIAPPVPRPVVARSAPPDAGRRGRLPGTFPRRGSVGRPATDREAVREARSEILTRRSLAVDSSNSVSASSSVSLTSACAPGGSRRLASSSEIAATSSGRSAPARRHTLNAASSKSSSRHSPAASPLLHISHYRHGHLRCFSA